MWIKTFKEYDSSFNKQERHTVHVMFLLKLNESVTTWSSSRFIRDYVHLKINGQGQIHPAVDRIRAALLLKHRTKTTEQV